MESFYLYKLPRLVKFVETESRVVVGVGRGKGELLSNGYRVSARDDKKIPGDGQW